jgi:hypothetical protein
MNRLILNLLLAAAALVGIASQASAQYYPRPGVRPTPYPIYPSPYYDPNTARGNALQGQAAVIQASGNVAVQDQQAWLMKTQVDQAKIDTKKKAFDQMMYEKANTPTYVEQLSQDKARILTRMMNYPVRGEIMGGKTLNEMLPMMQAFADQGVQGPPVRLTQSTLNMLNISSTGAGSVGMLRDGGKIEWPTALRGPEQKKLDKLLPAAVQATIDGELDAKLLKEVRKELKSMRESIRKKYQAEEIETASYVRALEVWDSLEPSVSALEARDAKKQLTGAYVPHVKNVQELVDFLTDNGVKFAPVSPGNENAYQVTHDAFVRYARAAQGSSGFQAVNAPATAPPGKKK